MAATEWEIRTKFKALEPVMDERLKRLWAGAEADAYGDGGIAAVERATGMSRTTIRRGRDELRAGARVKDVVNAQGLRVSPQKVGQLLYASGYSLQATHKTTEGTSHPDRNAQFEFINERAEEHHARGAPVISVDAKKKELETRSSTDSSATSPKTGEDDPWSIARPSCN